MSKKSKNIVAFRKREFDFSPILKSIPESLKQTLGAVLLCGAALAAALLVLSTFCK